jgi:proton-translocating NAD(P)+ transhydrogenase subunit alpha
MKIGILKESKRENRVVMLPEGVAALVRLKTDTLIEMGAGEKAYALDSEYEKAGARIVSREDIIKGSDIILSVNAPAKEDLVKMKEGQTIIGVLNPFFNPELVKELIIKNVTSFSLELLPRSTRAQSMDILSSQATVAGYKAVLDAANIYPGFMQMFMSAAGTIKPAKVLVLGAGIAGLQAIATAKRLGAVVEAFDVRSAAGEEVRSLGAKFIEVEGARDESSAGGYAVEQTEEYNRRQQQIIHEHAIKSNIIICTAQVPGRKAPLLIRKETIEQMMPGSVIIDLASSAGGNCEFSNDFEIIMYNRVNIVGRSYYPSDMPVDASRMFGKNVLNFLALIIDSNGNLNLNFEDDLVKGTCLTHNKTIVNEMVKNLLNS